MTLNSRGPRSSKLHVKYFRNGDRYDDGVNVSQIGNRSWAIEWHHHLWPWMTLNSPSSRSSKLHVKYFRNGEEARREEEGTPKVGSHPRCLKSWKNYPDCRIDLIGGGSNTDICPGRQTPSRRHCLGECCGIPGAKHPPWWHFCDILSPENVAGSN